MDEELYTQLNEHLIQAYYELGALYTELGDSPENKYIQEAIQLVKQEKDNIIEKMRSMESKKRERDIWLEAKKWS